MFATEPSILLGKVFMEEMIEFLDRAPRINKQGRYLLKVIQNGTLKHLSDKSYGWFKPSVSDPDPGSAKGLLRQKVYIF